MSINSFNKKLICAILIFFVFVIDIVTKKHALDFVGPNGEVKIFKYLNFVEVYNIGISFGLLSNGKFSNYVFLFISSLISIGLIYYIFFKEEKNLNMFSYSLIAAGALGNIYDRIKIGAVRDFIDFHIGGYHWPAFNIADSAICIGVFIILIESFIWKRK